MHLDDDSEDVLTFKSFLTAHTPVVQTPVAQQATAVQVPVSNMVPVSTINPLTFSQNVATQSTGFGNIDEAVATNLIRTIKTLNDVSNDDFVIEQYIIQIIFTNDRVQRKLLSYLTDDIFKTLEAQTVIVSLRKFILKYRVFPSAYDFKLSLNDSVTVSYFESCFRMLVTDYSEDFILDIVSEFIKKAKIFNEVAKTMDKLTEVGSSVENVRQHVEKTNEILKFDLKKIDVLDLLTPEGIASTMATLQENEYAYETDLDAFNKAAGGGIQGSALTLFVAPTNMGKTIILCHFASQSILAGRKVLFVTLEMPKHKIAERIIANIANISLSHLKEAEATKVAEELVNRSLMNGNLKIIFKSPRTYSADDMAMFLDELRDKENWVPHEIYIDYLLLMKTCTKYSSIRRDEELEIIAVEVRAIATDRKIPIVTVAQLNRSGYNNNEADLGNIAGSFAVATVADLAIIVTQPLEYKPLNEYMWLIDKSRFFMTGICIRIRVDFDHMRLIDGGYGVFNKEDGTPVDTNSRRSNVSPLVSSNATPNAINQLRMSNQPQISNAPMQLTSQPQIAHSLTVNNLQTPSSSMANVSVTFEEQQSTTDKLVMLLGNSMNNSLNHIGA